jgi:hypothetical protein
MSEEEAASPSATTDDKAPSEEAPVSDEVKMIVA